MKQSSSRQPVIHSWFARHSIFVGLASAFILSACGLEQKPSTPKTFAASETVNGTYKFITASCTGVDASAPTTDERSLVIKDASFKELTDKPTCKATLSRQINDLTSDRIKTKFLNLLIQQGCGEETFDETALLTYSYTLTGNLLKVSDPTGNCSSYSKSAQ